MALEHMMQCEVPKFSRNLLKLKGFHNVVSIKEMEKADIDDLEAFAQSDAILRCIPKEADLGDYFGDYASNVQSFELAIGYKKMLREIIDFTYSKYSTEGPQFFDPLKNANLSMLRTVCNRYDTLSNGLRQRGNDFTIRQWKYSQLIDNIYLISSKR